MQTYKIIGGDQKEYGPITAEQINLWIAQRRVDGQTKVQAEGGEWKTLGEFPEFAAGLGNRVPPSVPSAPNLPPFSTQPVRTSGLAIASLILGIMGFFTCGITAIVGLILGIVAMIKVGNSNGAQSGKGVALAGTIVSAVFLLLIPVGSAMLLPALAKAKQRAISIKCMNNMRQLALGARIYAGNHADRFPPAESWCDAIKSNVGSELPFQCPAALNNGQRCHYAFNARLDGMETRRVAPDTVLFFETEGGWNVSGGPELMLRQSRHGRTFAIAFADGHVEQATPERLAELRWNP